MEGVLGGPRPMTLTPWQWSLEMTHTRSTPPPHLQWTRSPGAVETVEEEEEEEEEVVVVVVVVVVVLVLVSVWCW